MSVFAHKADKSKFNLGNESDLTGIGDGTPFNGIKFLNDKRSWSKITVSLTFSTSEQSYQNDLLKGANEILVTASVTGAAAIRCNLLLTNASGYGANQVIYAPSYGMNGTHYSVRIMNFDSNAGSFKYVYEELKSTGSPTPVMVEILYR